MTTSDTEVLFCQMVTAPSPVGAVATETGSLAKENGWKFSTKYWDEETGLGYWGYRYYAPAISRWLNRDPLGEWGGASLYCHVLNNAVLFADANGLFSVPQNPNYFTVCGFFGDLMEDEADALVNMVDATALGYAEDLMEKGVDVQCYHTAVVLQLGLDVDVTLVLLRKQDLFLKHGRCKKTVSRQETSGVACHCNPPEEEIPLILIANSVHEVVTLDQNLTVYWYYTITTGPMPSGGYEDIVVDRYLPSIRFWFKDYSLVSILVAGTAKVDLDYSIEVATCGCR